MAAGRPWADPVRMLTVFVWVMAATAMWHFAVLVPDRFYGGIIGSLATANGGALLAGFLAAGFAVPETAGIADVWIGALGGLAGLAGSWLAGSRYDPVVIDERTS